MRIYLLFLLLLKIENVRKKKKRKRAHSGNERHACRRIGCLRKLISPLRSDAELRAIACRPSSKNSETIGSRNRGPGQQNSIGTPHGEPGASMKLSGLEPQMANDLARITQANLPSLPAWLGRLAIGTVDHPGQPTRKYLAGGLSLTPSQRGEAEAYRDRMKAALSSDDPLRLRNAVLAKMIMAYPMGAGSGELGAAARAEAYLDALSDMPAWAIAEAVHSWNRGQAGEHNYSFAPAPAILRRVVDGILAPCRVDLDKIEIALRAVSIERAVDPEPMAIPKSEPETLIPRLRKI